MTDLVPYVLRLLTSNTQHSFGRASETLRLGIRVRKVTSWMTIAVPIAGVSVIYSARPQDGIKMRCYAKRLWPGRAWGGTDKSFPANCFLSMTAYFYEDSATCGKNKSDNTIRQLAGNKNETTMMVIFMKPQPAEKQEDKGNEISLYITVIMKREKNIISMIYFTCGKLKSVYPLLFHIEY